MLSSSQSFILVMFPCVRLKPRSWLAKASIRAQLLPPGVQCPTCRLISTTSATDDVPLGSASKQRNSLERLPLELSYHWDTLPPIKEQLQYAETFFTRHSPTFLWSAPKFKSMSFGDPPEVCFLGRSNVGKSSLLNALLGKTMAHASSKPGRTQSMNAFVVGGNEKAAQKKLVILDMPGYGKGGRAEWGSEVLKYLEKRPQLKRAFLLVDTVHGLKASDQQLLTLFFQQGIPHQIILSKVDRLLFSKSRLPSDTALEERLQYLRRTMEIVKALVQPHSEETSGALGELISCSSEKRIDGKLLGIDSVRHAILQAAGLEYRPLQKRVEPQETVPFEEIKWTKEASVE